MHGRGRVISINSSQPSLGETLYEREVIEKKPLIIHEFEIFELRSANCKDLPWPGSRLERMKDLWEMEKKQK